MSIKNPHLSENSSFFARLYHSKGLHRLHRYAVYPLMWVAKSAFLPATLFFEPIDRSTAGVEVQTATDYYGNRSYGYIHKGGEQANKYLIFVPGNAVDVHSLHHEYFWPIYSLPASIKKHSHVLMVDHLRTGLTAITRSDVVASVYTQVAKLINEKKVKPEDITLYGHSLGGSIIPEVATLIEKQYRVTPTIICDRTFSDSATIANKVLGLLYYPIIIGLAAFAFFSASPVSLLLLATCVVNPWLQISEYFIAGLLKVAGWQTSVQQTYDAYSGPKACYNTDRDRVIPTDANLYTALKDKRTGVTNDPSCADHVTSLKPELVQRLGLSV